MRKGMRCPGHETRRGLFEEFVVITLSDDDPILSTRRTLNSSPCSQMTDMLTKCFPVSTAHLMDF